MEAMNRRYYTLEDIILKLTTTTSTNENYYLGKPFKRDATTNEIVYLFNHATGILTVDGTLPYAKTEANTLWCKYLAPMYLDHYVIYVDYEDDEPTTAEVNAAIRRWFVLFNNKLNQGYAKYSKLIALYAAEESNLLADVKSYTRYDDTPQSELVGGVYTYDDRHISTYSETGNNVGTKIERLEEIRNLYNDIYNQWASEFGGMFIND